MAAPSSCVSLTQHCDWLHKHSCMTAARPHRRCCCDSTCSLTVIVYGFLCRFLERRLGSSVKIRHSPGKRQHKLQHKQHHMCVGSDAATLCLASLVLEDPASDTQSDGPGVTWGRRQQQSEQWHSTHVLSLCSGSRPALPVQLPVLDIEPAGPAGSAPNSPGTPTRQSSACSLARSASSISSGGSSSGDADLAFCRHTSCISSTRVWWW